MTFAEQGFRKLQGLSFSYFDKTPVGWLMARMTSDVNRLGDTISWGLVDICWGLSMMFAISIVMFILNVKLALIVLMVVPFLVWISSKFQVLILQNYRKVRKINSRITASFNEGIMGVKTSKVLVREKKNLEEFQDLTQNMFFSSFQAVVYSSLYLPLVLFVGAVGSALALWFGGNGVIAGTISYGYFGGFPFLLEKLFRSYTGNRPRVYGVAKCTGFRGNAFFRF